MRTVLQYDVFRDEVVGSDGEIKRPVIGRDYYFYVIGASGLEEHTKIVDSFENHLENCGYIVHRFGDGEFKPGGDNTLYDYLQIPVDQAYQKDEILDEYRYWKVMKK